MTPTLSPGLPGDITKYRVIEILSEIGPELGLGAAALRYLDVMIRATKPEDWREAGDGPVCFLAQNTLAHRLRRDRSSITRLQRRLADDGLIEILTADNGARGRWLDESGQEVRLGIGFAPLIARFPEILALLEAREAEYAARKAARARLRQLKKTVRTLIEDCIERPALASLAQKIMDALGTLPSRTDRLGTAAIAKFTKLVSALRDRLLAALENKQMTEETPHARSENASRYIHNTIKPDSSICSRDAIRPDANASVSHTTAPKGAGDGLETSLVSNSGTAREKTDPVERFSPAQIYRIASAEMRSYLDFYAEDGKTGFSAIQSAAWHRSGEIGINATAWTEAVATMGPIRAAIAVAAIDRNRTHPTTPVRKPGGLLRQFTRLDAAGDLRLAASVHGILSREDAAAVHP